MRVANISTVETSLFNYTEVCEYLKTDSVRSKDSEYPSIRIPGMVTLDDGTILAYCECREGGDWSAIDISMRRSADGGKTWSDRKIVVSGRGKHTMNNPVMFADGNTVHLLYCENYKRVYYKKSIDKGNNWADPVELTESIEKQTADFYWSVIAIGPGHGIKTSNGRLIAPIWMAGNIKEMFSHHPSVTASIFSDDGGETWKIGQIIDGEEPNEASVAELSDGRIMLNIRTCSPKKCRRIAISCDGGETWSKVYDDENLIDPINYGAICIAKDSLLFANCQSQTARENVVLKRSYDEGKTWECLQICKPGGYCEVNYSTKNDRAYVLFETENYKYIKCAEVEL